MNPGNLFRKSVAALNDWFEKADREEMEQRKEVLRPPDETRPGKQRVGRDLDGSKVIDFRQTDMTPAGIAEIVPAAKKAAPSPHATPATQGELTPSDSDARAHSYTPTPNDMIFSGEGDPHYGERNRLVRQIGEKYSQFGDAVASSVLQRCLVEDGVQLLVTKLGLAPEGDDRADHQQVLQFIEENGIAKFCEVVGIRTSSTGSVHGRGSGEPYKVAQNLSGRSKKAGGESHLLEMKRIRVEPITLGNTTEDSQSDAEAASTTPATLDLTPAAEKPLLPPPEQTPPQTTPPKPMHSIPAPSMPLVSREVPPPRPLTPPPETSRHLQPPPEYHEPKRAEPKTLSPVSLSGKPVPKKSVPAPKADSPKDLAPRELTRRDIAKGHNRPITQGDMSRTPTPGHESAGDQPDPLRPAAILHNPAPLQNKSAEVEQKPATPKRNVADFLRDEIIMDDD